MQAAQRAASSKERNLRWLEKVNPQVGLAPGILRAHMRVSTQSWNSCVASVKRVAKPCKGASKSCRPLRGCEAIAGSYLLLKQLKVRGPISVC